MMTRPTPIFVSGSEMQTHAKTTSSETIPTTRRRGMSQDDEESPSPRSTANSFLGSTNYETSTGPSDGEGIKAVREREESDGSPFIKRKPIAVVSEDDAPCPACMGRHRAHTCGKLARKVVTTSSKSHIGTSALGRKMRAGGRSKESTPPAMLIPTFERPAKPQSHAVHAVIPPALTIAGFSKKLSPVVLQQHPRPPHRIPVFSRPPTMSHLKTRIW